MSSTLEFTVPAAKRSYPATVLTRPEMLRLERFGERRHYAAGHALLTAGRVGPGIVILLEGSVSVIVRDALGRTVVSVRTAKAPDGAQGEEVVVSLADGRDIRSRTVVIATGARYRRPAVARLAEFEGRGVWYWASPIEARLCRQQRVALVGAGNSAGQAAVFLASHVEHISMLIRGDSLESSMSKYLVDRIRACSNIELLVRHEIQSLDGDEAEGLQSVTWADRTTGITQSRPLRNLFLFVGAEPELGFLGACPVGADEAGFVLTGTAVRQGNETDPARSRFGLETSVPGVFAAGDVRSGSVKRVGGAIGEGATLVAQIHQYLARIAE